mmetsp:Transcript_1340/g.2713  ORF Transcript_1340/g.2713 Transcript_1340/m.2713 type:complete len:88 (+) Transcript_1340:1415-1678(+)
MHLQSEFPHSLRLPDIITVYAPCITYVFFAWAFSSRKRKVKAVMFACANNVRDLQVPIGKRQEQTIKDIDTNWQTDTKAGKISNYTL